MPPSSASILVGQTSAHLCTDEQAHQLGAPVHADVVAPFQALRDAATADGFDIAIDSGFRGFDRQLAIWNAKARGERAVLDSSGRPLDIATLTPKDLVFAILRWSALPGASRHHWGTDIDVFDRAARPDGYDVQLVPAEVDPGGMFAPLHEWLDGRIADGTAFGFVRPYDADRGGVAPERWHLSYAPLAIGFTRQLTLDLLRTTISTADLLLKDVVLANLEAIVERFVTNVSPAAA